MAMGAIYCMKTVWQTDGDKSHEIKMKHEQKGGKCTNTNYSDALQKLVEK